VRTAVFGSCVSCFFIDTDSVFVLMPERTPIAEAIVWGHESGPAITKALFEAPMKLRYEKVLCPYISIAKKRYAGRMFETGDETKPEIYMRGIETVRRDWCPLVGTVMMRCLELTVGIDANIDECKAYVRDVISNLYRRKVSIGELMITKTWNKTEYKNTTNPPAHAVVVQKKQERGERVSIGDRVSYVVLEGASKGARLGEHVEDTVYSLKHKLGYDVDYYVHTQLKGPLSRLLEPILGKQSTHELFYGDHTLVRKSVPLKSARGKITQFMKPKKMCIACSKRQVVPNESVCSMCDLKETMARFHDEEADLLEFNKKCWLKCLDCQAGDVDSVNDCVQTTCSELWPRLETERKLEDLRNILEEAGWD
jgi:DNA polymerase delta subunit 1